MCEREIQKERENERERERPHHRVALWSPDEALHTTKAPGTLGLELAIFLTVPFLIHGGHARHPYEKIGSGEGRHPYQKIGFEAIICIFLMKA